MSADAEHPGMRDADAGHPCGRTCPDTQRISVEIVEVEDTRDWATAAGHPTAAGDGVGDPDIDHRAWPPGGMFFLRPEDVPGWKATPARDGPEDRPEHASEEEAEGA